MDILCGYFKMVSVLVSNIIDYCGFIYLLLNLNIWTGFSQGFSDRNCKYDFVVTPGIELRDFVVDSISAVSPHKCALQCLSRTDCMSFNFQDFTKLCQLNGASLSCVPDHVVFNGTMRHFSPPTAQCWKVMTIFLKSA